METTLEADRYALEATGDGGRLGTEHLLTAVAGSSGPAGAALAAAGAAEEGLRRLLRDRDGGGGGAGGGRDGDREHGGGWGADDGADAAVPAREVLGPTGAPDLVLTGAAARALSAAVAEARRGGERRLTAEHVLRALLADDRSRAAELLRAAGVAPRAVLERLDGVPAVLDSEPSGAPDGVPHGVPAVVDGGPVEGAAVPAAPESSDSLDPLLIPTREALLGRRTPRLPRWKRLWQPGAAGSAAPSSDWIRPEADAQAQRLGRRTPGTEHVLLALLAVHEVLRHQPRPDVDDAGGELLARLGVDYARAYAAVTAGTIALPADPRSVEAYLAGAAPGPLVRVLLDEDTRARRLVEALRGDGGGIGDVESVGGADDAGPVRAG
ncbi:Clp protease N-terminal domain-containing protein [Kitasatospora sp. NPDC086791]|uniref:Clp protease N-terminal domain-containing protein n=1 Tax=Kitasatospora sp. NPDC086791 TaxID=3155178 RepID=UPI0034120D7B